MSAAKCDMSGSLSATLAPGTRLRHKDGTVVVLERRKQPGEGSPRLPFFPGWWVRDGGGLADRVIDADDGCWTVLDAPDAVQRAVAAHEAYVGAGRRKVAAVRALNEDQRQEMTRRIKALRAEGRDV